MGQPSQIGASTALARADHDHGMQTLALHDLTDLDAQSQWLLNFPDPILPQSPATKSYVDHLVQGLAHREPVLDFLPAPLPGPVEGDTYIVRAVAASAPGVVPAVAAVPLSGVFVGHSLDLAEWKALMGQPAAWVFTTPGARETRFVEDLDETWTYRALVPALNPTVRQQHYNLYAAAPRIDSDATLIAALAGVATAPVWGEIPVDSFTVGAAAGTPWDGFTFGAVVAGSFIWTGVAGLTFSDAITGIEARGGWLYLPNAAGLAGQLFNVSAILDALLRSVAPPAALVPAAWLKLSGGSSNAVTWAATAPAGAKSKDLFIDSDTRQGYVYDSGAWQGFGGAVNFIEPPLAERFDGMTMFDGKLWNWVAAAAAWVQMV
jgi:hypothetical protein